MINHVSESFPSLPTENAFCELEQAAEPWNRTATDYPRDRCIHDLFEEQVTGAPLAVALIWRDRPVTYGELNARANQLAHHLRNLGVRENATVAVHVGRSLEYVVSVLGILKSGGIYVPLAMDYPGDRLRFMLQDSGAAAVINHVTPPASAPSLELPAGLVAVDLQRDAARIRKRSERNPESHRSADAAAYIMYTSGSTGRPKGVMIPHRGVVRLVRGQQYAAFGPGERFLLLSSTAFDASTFELWGPLLNGATCVVFPQELSHHAELERFVRHHHVSCLWLTAGLFNQIIDQRPSVLESVRHVLTGGDALSVSHVARARELFPKLRLTNGYGPTESTTFACTYPVGQETCFPHGNVPIGRPIANTYCRILDSHGRPTAIGVPGELHLGGDGLAHGYINLPDLTNKSFIPDPFSSEPGRRLYRTGDLARYLPDGTIEFLGRRDRQVKIRGYRVEPGEIESALGGHAPIRACAVVAKAFGHGEKELVAFLVSDNEALSVRALRSRLAQTLPDHMIPSRFVILEALPLTPNGKVDRHALERLSAESLPVDTRYEAPRTGLERQLVEIWQAVLRRQGVGIHDNFFELGGHSLSALSLVATVRDRLAFDVPQRWVFDYPTIAALTRQIERLPNDADVPQPIARADRNRPLAMSFGQQRMWLLRQTQSDPATYNEPVAYRLVGAVDCERLRACLRRLMERHEMLRTALVRRGEALLQQVESSEDTSLAWREVDWRDAAPEELDERLRAEARQPFDLAQVSLWRCLWARVGADSHILLLTFHHALVDEWSLRVFFRELEQLYVGRAGESRREGGLEHREFAGETQRTARDNDPDERSWRSSSDGRRDADGLETLSVQYADFAAWQHQRVTGPLRESLQAYWTRQLRQLPPAVRFATDVPSVEHDGGPGGLHRFPLPPDVVVGLRKLAWKEQSSLFSLMLAAFQAWLYLYTGQTDVVVATPASNRRRSDLRHVLGFFLNTLPIRTPLDGQTCFREVLRRVRTTVLDGLDHADFPFEEMSALATQDREGGRLTLRQIMFVLVEEGTAPWRLGAIEAFPLPVDTGTSKCELTMNVTATNDAWTCHWEYASDLFTPSAVQDMTALWVEWLRWVVANPDERIGRFIGSPRPDRPTLQQPITSQNEAHLGPADLPIARELALETRYEPPRSELEGRLIEIWQAVLQREGIGIHHDFFELGGHSLLAVAAVSRIQEELGVLIPLSLFFANPTVGQLGLVVERERLRAASGRTDSADDTEAPLFLLGWYLDLSDLGISGRRQYVLPFPDFELTGDRCRVEFLAERCLRTLRRVRPHGPYLLAGYSLAGLVAYEMACVLRGEGEEVRLAIIDTAPAGRARRLAPAVLGPVGAAFRLPFRSLLLPARTWDCLVDFIEDVILRGPLEAYRSLTSSWRKVWRRWRGRQGRRSPVAAGAASPPPRRPADTAENALLGRFWAHRWAYSAYRPRPYDGSVALFASDQLIAEHPEPGCGWGRWVGAVRQYRVPGTHSSCIRAHKAELAREFRTWLAQWHGANRAQVPLDVEPHDMVSR